MSKFINAHHPTDIETGTCPECYTKGYEEAEAALKPLIQLVRDEFPADWSLEKIAYWAGLPKESIKALADLEATNENT